jgi:cytochrome c biogenesis protein CcdA/thiol-disulfide isomerase/thioredoxin
VIVLIGIGLAAGLITALSPCVLPVLPILLAGGASGQSARRPFAIVAGLVASFTVFTLIASRLLRALGLPQDFLRNLAIVLLFLLAATLLFPSLARLAERPFLFLTRRSGNDLGGGFLLGASLGLVFVPCAGPVLAAVTVVAANQNVGFKSIALTLSYAIGAAVPMVAIALGGQRFAQRLRGGAPRFRQGLGVLIAATALAIALGADTRFQTALPGYTTWLQNKIESNATAKRELAKVVQPRATNVKAGVAGLPDFGPAPDFIAGGRWFNSSPLTVRELRGKVVLVDFWTYSCINCLRTLPQLEAWDARYRAKGLVSVGVHTPEFAFEHKASNVSSAIKRLGVKYPVVQDNDFATWNAYSNQYWPAEYMIDKSGHVRHAHFGEGEYQQTEKLLRRLLGVTSAPMTNVKNTTPSGLLTPESYLGTARIDRVIGDAIHAGVPWTYEMPKAVPQNNLAYGGRWTIEKERAVAVKDARLRLRFSASKVYLVLGGHGSVDVLVDGKPLRTVRVDGDRLYTLVDSAQPRQALLELRFAPGISGYAFTFG